MLVGFAYGFMSLSEADFSRLPDNVTKRGRKSLIAVMKKSTENCMYLSRNSLNLISLSLLHKNLLLETVIHGDFCKFGANLSFQGSDEAKVYQSGGCITMQWQLQLRSDYMPTRVDQLSRSNQK